MAHISYLGSSSNTISDLSSTSLKSGAQKPPSSPPAAASAHTDQAQASPLQAQLTRLSGVLNSLQAGANATRAQYVHAYNQVKAGTYQIDPLDVSRSLVNDLLKNQ